MGALDELLKADIHTAISVHPQLKDKRLLPLFSPNTLLLLIGRDSEEGNLLARVSESYLTYFVSNSLLVLHGNNGTLRMTRYSGLRTTSHQTEEIITDRDYIERYLGNHIEKIRSPSA